MLAWSRSIVSNDQGLDYEGEMISIWLERIQPQSFVCSDLVIWVLLVSIDLRAWKDPKRSFGHSSSLGQYHSQVKVTRWPRLAVIEVLVVVMTSIYWGLTLCASTVLSTSHIFLCLNLSTSTYFTGEKASPRHSFKPESIRARIQIHKSLTPKAMLITATLHCFWCTVFISLRFLGKRDILNGKKKSSLGHALYISSAITLFDSPLCLSDSTHPSKASSSPQSPWSLPIVILDQNGPSHL